MSFHNGYYLAPDGTLRHCHSNVSTISGRGYITPQWHIASNVHPATPNAHHQADAFNVNLSHWAHANKDLSPTMRQHLIDEARDMHDIAARNR